VFPTALFPFNFNYTALLVIFALSIASTWPDNRDCLFSETHSGFQLPTQKCRLLHYPFLASKYSPQHTAGWLREARFDFARDTGYPEVLLGFPQILHANSGGWDNILKRPQPFPSTSFLIHPSSHHSTVHSADTVSVVKQTLLPTYHCVVEKPQTSRFTKQVQSSSAKWPTARDNITNEQYGQDPMVTQGMSPLLRKWTRHEKSIAVFL
jgi:hypothetical protein